MKPTLSVFCFFIALFGAFEIAFAGSVPTDSDKFSTLRYTVYSGTLITEEDYLTNTELKPFEAYDFTVESAPCTALGEYYSKDDANNTIYSLEVGAHTFQFMCRQVSGMGKESYRRLYMLGSSYDCHNRPFDFSKSALSEYRELGKLCSNDNRQEVRQMIEYAYLQTFHPTKFYMLTKI